MNIAQDTVTAAAVIGALAPLGIAIVNRPSWSTQRKQLVAAAASVVLAVVALALTGGFDGFSLATAGAAVLAVAGAAQTAYALLWRPTGAAPAVEAATTPQKQPYTSPH